MEASQKMNPEVKAKWLEALRSGEYRQGRELLHPEEGSYCCLGVLCDVVDPGGWSYDSHDGQSAFPSDYVLDSCGLSERAGAFLAARNDGDGDYHPHTFEELANYIEENL